MKISVITPVYNAEKYVEKAVLSALQFEEVFEVILIEDKSPDNALEVCLRLEKEHPRVKLFQHPDKGNHGAGPTRNLGIEKATGDYIAFLDADDYYLPNRFDAEKKLFKNTDVEGVYGAIGVEYYSEKAKQQYFSIYKDDLTTVYKHTEPKEVFPSLMFLRGAFGLFSLDALTLRRESLQKMDYYFLESLRLHQDSEFILRLSFYLDLYSGTIDKAVALRGVHESNRITQVDSKKQNPAKTRVVLWKEINNWAQKVNSIPEDYKKHIYRMYKSFDIANTPFPVNYIKFVKNIFTDFNFVKNGLYNTNYRKILFPFLKK